MIIGITGTDGSGKGTVVDYLVREKGVTHYSAREYITREIKRRELPVNRKNMRIVANDLRRVHGNDHIIREYITKAKEAGIKDAVIESVRERDAAVLIKREGVLLATDADVHVRYDRIQSRASESDAVSFEEFVAQEELEMRDPDPNGMQKRAVMEMADYTIQNNGTLEELHEQIDEVFRKIEATSLS